MVSATAQNEQARRRMEEMVSATVLPAIPEQFEFALNDETQTEQALRRLADALGLKTPVGLSALRLAARNVQLLDSKQQDYGSGNISAFGEMGVLVRSSDKVERLKTLLKSGAKPKHESISDTWADLANYGLIGEMCHCNQWPGTAK